jgi:hypothetical protein
MLFRSAVVSRARTLIDLSDCVLASDTGSRAIDVEVEFALFRPDERHRSAQPGVTAECVEYTTWAGRIKVFPAYCWSLDPVETAAMLHKVADAQSHSWS